MINKVKLFLERLFSKRLLLFN